MRPLAINPNTDQMKTPTIKELKALLIHCKSFIDDDCRTSDDPDDSLPGMCVTIGWNPEDGSWNWQTGDNSYTGGAYGFPVWAVVYLYRRSSCVELARAAKDELLEQTW